MRTSRLEHKTIRPGLMSYSFYASARQPAAKAPLLSLPKLGFKPRLNFWPVVVTLAIVAGLVIGYKSIGSFSQPVITSNGAIQAPNRSAPVPSGTPAVLTTANSCDGNSQAQLIKVSISQRHLWACEGAKAVYNTPVVTGMEAYAADRTPVGTYHIYAKQTNTVLTGSDTTGNWSDPVSYWMPFMNNQYGTYGLHDATWRNDNDFGKVDPNSGQASHGCVELPLAASKWLYDWSQVGTTVAIQS